MVSSSMLGNTVIKEELTSTAKELLKDGEW
jgi:hypothetical protein